FESCDEHAPSKSGTSSCVERVLGDIGRTVIGQPFDKMWRLAGPEPTLDANNHQIAHHFAGDAGGRGRPGDDFPIGGVDSEQDTEELAIAASELEMIHQRIFERRAITTPSWVRPGRRPVCRSRVSLLTCMIRSTRLALIAGLPSAFCCRFTKRVMRRYP